MNTNILQLSATSLSTSIYLKWNRWVSTTPNKYVVYAIYFSEVFDSKLNSKDPLESIEPKFLSFLNEVTIPEFIPGSTYQFIIKPIEISADEKLIIENYFSKIYKQDYNLDLYLIPYGELVTNITADFILPNTTPTVSDLNISILDSSVFPNSGDILIGSEVIRYEQNDIQLNTLKIINKANRGLYNSLIRYHNVGGYDGKYNWNNYKKNVTYYFKNEIDVVGGVTVVVPAFEFPEYQKEPLHTNTTSGTYHKNTEDIINPNLKQFETNNTNFKEYNYTGWHRIEPQKIVDGGCIGSYMGGEIRCCPSENCKDGIAIRPNSIKEAMFQRQEMMLNVVGANCVLLKRSYVGIYCACFTTTVESADSSCPLCFGSGFVLGYEQYFSRRDSSGKIKVRFEPYEETISHSDYGIDDKSTFNAWMLPIPIINKGDILIKYDEFEQEFGRYEVLAITRNSPFLSINGAQKCRLALIRKTEHIYKLKVFSDISLLPEFIETTQVSTSHIESHQHVIIKSEKAENYWEQLTSINAGHNHEVIYNNGQIQIKPILNHTHIIINPLGLINSESKSKSFLQQG